MGVTPREESPGAPKASGDEIPRVEGVSPETASDPRAEGVVGESMKR
jgi:hypothetical protein